MGHAQKIDFNFDPLIEDNYEVWKVKVKDLLTKMNLWKYADKKSPSKLSDTYSAEWEINNKNAKSIIMLTITNKTLKELNLESDLTASETFEKIDNFFGKKNPDDVINILQKLLMLAQLAEGVDIRLALNNFFDTIDKLKDLKINLYKNSFLLSNILLTILPPSFKKLKLKLLSDDKLPDVTLLGIKILEYYDKILLSDEDDDDTEEEEEEEEEGGGAEKNSEEEKIINKNISEIKDQKNNSNDSGYNESYSPENSNNSNELFRANYETEHPSGNQSVAYLLDQMLNRKEYKSQNDNCQNICSFPQIFDQEDCQSNCLQSTDQDRNHLRSLLKAASEKTSTSTKPKRCSICREEGHNKRTCDKISFSPKTSSTSTPKRTYKCGLCGDEGHNKTTCLKNKSESVSKSSSSSLSSETPKKTYKCSNCNKEGHNITTCPAKNLASEIVTSTPKRTYTCSNCGQEGHNKTSCLKNIQTAVSLLENSASRSYSCGICGSPGHNRQTCPSNAALSNVSSSSFNQRSLSSPVSSGTRSYSCGLCGGQGHNRTTCSLNYTSSSRTSSSYSCGGGSGGGGGSTRSYSCGTCGGSGHNSRTCSYR